MKVERRGENRGDLTRGELGSEGESCGKIAIENVEDFRKELVKKNKKEEWKRKEEKKGMGRRREQRVVERKDGRMDGKLKKTWEQYIQIAFLKLYV